MAQQLPRKAFKQAYDVYRLLQEKGGWSLACVLYSGRWYSKQRIAEASGRKGVGAHWLIRGFRQHDLVQRKKWKGRYYYRASDKLVEVVDMAVLLFDEGWFEDEMG